MSQQRPSADDHDNPDPIAQDGDTDGDTDGESDDESDDDAESAASERPRYGLIHVGVALFAVLLVSALVVVDYLPTHDGPQSLFLGWLDNHYDDPSTHYRTFLKPGEPATSLGFQLAFSSLEGLLPWRTALRVTLALIGLAFGGAFYWLVRSLAPERSVIGLLGFALAPQWALYMGFFSFTLATALSFGVLALALSRWPWSSDRRFVIAVLMTLVGVAHLFPAQLLGLSLVCVVAAQSKGTQRFRELALLAAMALPLFAILLVTAGATGLPAELSGASTMPLGERLSVWLRCFASGPWWRGGVVALLALAGLASVLRPGRQAIERGLAIASLLLLALGLALPLHTEGWQFLSPRVLPLGFMLALALLPIERLASPMKQAASGAIVLFGLASLGWTVWYNTTLRARSEGFLAGLDAPLSRRGPRLPIVLDPYAGDNADWREQQVPFSAPALNLGMLYATAQGGVPPYLFADRPTLHPFVLSAAGSKRYPVAPDPRSVAAFYDSAEPDPLARADFMRWVAFLGTRYEDIIVYGHPADFAPLKTAGYLTDFDNDQLFIGRFEGCPVTLVVLAQAERIRVASGWTNIQQSKQERIIVPRTQPPYTIDVGRLPCGQAWLQPAIEQNGQLHRCSEADTTGVYPLALKPGAAQTLRCTPR